MQRISWLTEESLHAVFSSNGLSKVLRCEGKTQARLTNGSTRGNKTRLKLKGSSVPQMAHLNPTVRPNKQPMVAFRQDRTERHGNFDVYKLDA